MSDGRPRQFKSPSALKFEIQRSTELLNRWLSYELNRFFDLTVEGARYRGIRAVVFALSIFVGGFLIEMLLATGLISTARSQDFLSSLAIVGVIGAFRVALILGIAILFAFGTAGDYLADIFELKDVRVAWKFIGRLMLARSSEVLHVRDGGIPEEDRNSPMVQIGGPGYVITTNDTAVLFEGPDGTPHVVGPVPGDRGDPVQTLAGFERLRKPVVSLRDQYIGSLGGEPITVVGRSLDGMPVSAVDVRGVYSIRRQKEDAAAQDERPYPFDPKALEDLVYGQVVPVLTDGPYPSGLPSGWNTTMQELIRESLAEFMSRNKLGEYVAGVGEKELELSEFRDDTILSQTLQLASEAGDIRRGRDRLTPRFLARTELTAQFQGHDAPFARQASQHGLELHWIGVGTWQMPDDHTSEVVKEKHLEAWRIHREIAARGESAALEATASTAVVEEKLRLIQEVPVASHQKNSEKYSDKGVLVECLLQDFWEQMGDALALCYQDESGASEREGLEAAVSTIEELLQIRQLGYLVGGGTMSRVRPKSQSPKKQAPPAPTSRGEAEGYRALLGKLGGDYAVAERMISNESKRHPGLNREAWVKGILLRFERYGR